MAAIQRSPPRAGRIRPAGEQVVPRDEDAFEELRALVEARDKFLEEHPELKPLQEEINRIMRNVGSS